MEERKINSHEELRAAVAELNAHIVQMCGSKTVENLIDEFVVAKDLLIAVYKYQTLKLTDNKDA